MKPRALLVDDDPNLLSGYQRVLRQDFTIETASGGQQALEMIAEQKPYAVIVSDLRMPIMDGITFLSEARRITPDSVRIMLTGMGDLDTAMRAVNEGHVFRFLQKPCPGSELAATMKAGARQYRLITAEHELLEKTLKGSIKVMSDVLAMVSPQAFARSARVRRIMREMARGLERPNGWEFELAGMLSQLGCVTLPVEIVNKQCRGEPLTRTEEQMFATHPQAGHDLLIHIPRLKNVAEAILYQEKQFNGEGTPEDHMSGDEIPLCARALHVALHFDDCMSQQLDFSAAIEQLRLRPHNYDPALVDVLAAQRLPQINHQSLQIGELREGMVLASDILTGTGTLIVAKGQDVNESLLCRLRNFDKTLGVVQPIHVYMSAPDEAGNTPI